MPSDSNSRIIVRDALGIGIGVAAYGFGFGALGISAGLSFWQTMTLSLVMYTGASQFALLGVIAGGGSFSAAIAAAWLLGIRNLPYAIRMKSLIRPTGWKIPIAAQLTIDESTAMALAHQSPDGDTTNARKAFWYTGLSVYVFWNLATMFGAFAAAATSDPAALGLDAAISAGFVALIWPQLDTQLKQRLAIGAGMVALILIPLTAPGIPILIAGAIAGGIGLTRRLEVDA
jgi:predicted branched-subunit amino acid permease